MTTWNLDFKKEIDTFNESGLKETYKHLTNLQAVAKKARQRKAGQEIQEHLDAVRESAKKFNLSF